MLVTNRRQLLLLLVIRFLVSLFRSWVTSIQQTVEAIWSRLRHGNDREKDPRGSKISINDHLLQSGTRGQEEEGCSPSSRNLLIVCDVASDLVHSLIQRLMHGNRHKDPPHHVYSCIIIASPDVTGLLRIGRHVFLDSDREDDDEQEDKEEKEGNGVKDRIFLQPNQFANEESINDFVSNLRINSRLRLHEILLMMLLPTTSTQTGSSDGNRSTEISSETNFIDYFLLRLQESALLLPTTHIMVVSSSITLLLNRFDCQQQHEDRKTSQNEGSDEKEEEIARKSLIWMFVLGNTCSISVSRIPRLSTSLLESNVQTFLLHWISFLYDCLFAMNPHYVSSIIIDTLDSYSRHDDHPSFFSLKSSSFFIYDQRVTLHVE